MNYIVCFSGGKDSTAMLIHLLENNKPIDEILYVDMGDWMWESAQSHIKQVEDSLGVSITQLDVTDKITNGFKRWGFPAYLNRWCTGIKRDVMRDYLKERYDVNKIVQYIGYCSDEEKRTNKKLYSSYDTEYPLVDANITTEQALQLCKDYGFDFGGVYEHHSHFNCWLCPLQKVDELRWVFDNDKEKWDYLRDMQYQSDGTFLKDKSVFECEHNFWKKHHKELHQKRMDNRKKYATKRGVYNK